MTNLNVRIVATANVAPAQAALGKLTAQNEILNSTLAQTADLQNKALNPGAWRAAQGVLRQNSQTFRDAAASGGMLHTSQLKLNSATEDYVKLLQKQKVGLGQFLKSRKLSAAAYKEQLALQNMFIRQTGTNDKGQGIFDTVYNPRVAGDMKTARNSLQYLREELNSVSQQTVNWGKNTQWAGRQLMVGFTMPIVAAGAAMAVLAYNIDKELTRVQKVYNTTASQNDKTERGQMQLARELGQVRSDSLAVAKNAAQQYGASAKDTLNVEADLAATGIKGAALRQATTEVVKNATLGEIDYQTALQATIAMQSTLRLNQKQTSDAWAYMNSIENSTSLQMKDFAEAIPIAAAPIQRMGGDIKLLGEYLVSMRERGIKAAEGANAIKAILQRLYRPSKQVREEFEKLTHVDLGAMVEKNRGNVKGMMEDLAEATRGLNRPEQIKSLAGLFGTWQVTRIGAILDGVRDLKDGIGQVSVAHRIGEQSAKQWAQTQEYELEQMRKSLSGKFRIALETLKTSLLDTGNVFLKVGVSILGVVNKIVSRFNALPENAKKLTAYAAIALAVAGPLVMLTGLFANLVGTAAKFGLAIAGLGGRFNLLTAEQKAAQLAGDLAEASFLKGSTASELYKADILQLAEAYRVANAESTRLSNSILQQRAASAGGSFSPSPVAFGTTGGVVGPPTQAAAQQQALTSANAANADKTDKSIHRAAAGMALFGVAAAASMFSTNKLVDNLANASMAALMIAPALGLVATGLKKSGGYIVDTILPGLGNVRSSTSSWMRSFTSAPSKIGAVGNGIKGLGKGIYGLLGPMGLFVAAIAAAAFAWTKISQNAKKAGDEVKNTYNNADALAKIYGYAQTESVQVQGGNNAAEKQVSNVRKIANAYSALLPKIRNAGTEQKAFNEAFRGVGMQVIQTGGTVEQAKQATRDALEAAVGVAEAKKIMIQFGANMDDIDSLMNQVARSSQMSLDDAMKSVNDKGLSEKVKSVISVMWDPNHGDKIISNEAKQQLIAGAKNLRALFDQEMETGGDTSGVVNAVVKQLGQIDKKIADSTGLERKRYQDMRKQFILAQGSAFGLDKVISNQTDDFYENADALTLLDKLYVKLSRRQQQLLSMNRANPGANLKPKDINNVTGPSAGLQGQWHGIKNDVELTAKQFNNMPAKVKDTASASNDVAKGMDKGAAAASRLAAQITKAKEAVPYEEVISSMQTAMSNTQDQIAEIATSNFENRMNDAMKAYQDAQERTAETLRKNQERASEKLQNDQDRESRRLENRQDRQSRALDERSQAQSDALDQRQQKASNALDKKWEDRNFNAERRWDRREKAITAAYDNRIAGINKTIKAEERAEEIRQRIFDAEQTRMERLAEMANNRIDFNAALGSGNLDEAARVRNQMEATQGQWALADTGTEESNKSQDKIDRLQGRIDNIEKLKDKRLEAFKLERDAFFKNLKDMEDREKNSLKIRQDRQKKNLDKTLEAEKRNLQRRQEAAKRSLDTRQKRENKALQNKQTRESKHLQREIDNNTAAQQEIWENRRDKLNRAIEDFKAYVPRNAKDLQNHINKTAKKYGEFRVDQRGKFRKVAVDVKEIWLRQINQARTEMSSKINWALSGAQITDKILSGAFGLGRSGFYKWMTTGIFPEGKKPPTTKELRQKHLDSLRSTHNAHRGGTQIDAIIHEGGYLGGNTLPYSRKGVARTAKHHSSEVNALLQKGEYVVQRKAVNQYGKETFDALNKGKVKTNANRGVLDDHRGQPMKKGILGGAGGLSLAGLLGGILAAAVKSGISTAANFGAENAIAAAMNMGGVYTAGSLKGFSSEQMNNAATIANVGSELGASKRDIQIALITALVESGLHNLKYGDRDSVGLFQQRAAWGSFADRTDPQKSARMFFTGGQGGQRGLFDFPNRAGMGMGEAAQAVQVSRFPSRYADYIDEAKAIMAAMTYTPGAIGGGNRYKLPGVKPWVKEAAEFLGPKYGINTIYGVGSRSTPGSDHPKGLALDYMTNNVNTGNRLAAEVIAKNKLLDASYVIWRQRINSFDGRGWRRMEDRGGRTENHMDHVHVSFDKTGDVDGLVRTGVGQDGVIQGSGGRHRPVRGGHPGGIHDSYTGYPATDVPVPVGSKVYAPGDGTISRSFDIRGYEPRSNHGGLGYRSYGRVIYEKLNSGPEVLMAHLSKRYARAGQRVRGGSLIGLSGNTGHSFGPHLHFGAKGISPYAFFKEGARDIRWDNTMANLHHGEAVLSKPINDEFKRGVKNFADGGNNTYNVDMHFNGDVNDRAGMRRFIIQTFNSMNDGLPQTRKGTD